MDLAGDGFARAVVSEGGLGGSGEGEVAAAEGLQGGGMIPPRRRLRSPVKVGEVPRIRLPESTLRKPPGPEISLWR